MRRIGIIAVGLLAVALYAGFNAWDNWQIRKLPGEDTMAAASEGLLLSEEVNDIAGWKEFYRIREFPQSIIDRANDGEPDASLEYGYHLLARAIVREEDVQPSEPYLTTGAMAGNLGAHVQLGLIEAALKDNGDLVRAWAHFDVALTKLKPGDADYPSSKKHYDQISEALSETQRSAAQSLSDEILATIKANGNALK